MIENGAMSKNLANEYMRTRDEFHFNQELGRIQTKRKEKRLTNKERLLELMEESRVRKERGRRVQARTEKRSTIEILENLC